MNIREYNITSAVRGKQNGVFGNTAVSFNETSTKGLVNLHGHNVAEIDFSRKKPHINKIQFKRAVFICRDG